MSQAYSFKDQPVDYYEPRSNTAGLIGFLLSLIGIFFCGITCPIGMLMSLAGMRREHNRGLAIAGFIIGIFGTLELLIATLYVVFCVWIATTVISAMGPEFERMREEAETRGMIQRAEADIEDYRAENGELPDGVEGNKRILDMKDAWGMELRYEPSDDAPNGYVIRSAGPDGQCETDDDFTSIDGESGLDASGAGAAGEADEAEEMDEFEFDADGRIELREPASKNRDSSRRGRRLRALQLAA